MISVKKALAVVAAVLVSASMVTGCASKTDSGATTSTATKYPMSLGEWIRYSGVLQNLTDTNSVLGAMQKTALIKITDSKTLATYVTQMKAEGKAAAVIGQSLSSLTSPDPAFDTAAKALGTSLATLGATARGLDAVKMATAGAQGADSIKTIVAQLKDAVTKTQAAAAYAKAHAKDTVQF